jgi:aminoacyl-tRNA hydrolase
VVGLGNPGDAYRDTPHNVGQRVLDRLARSLGREWVPDGEAMVAHADWRGTNVRLIKLLTSVNGTGPSLAAVVRRLGVGPDGVILVHDDLDLPVGVVRARMRGSAGGHHGVHSVIEAFQTSTIRRVKIGIGRPAQKAQVRDHVLTAFTPGELPLIETACDVAADRVLTLIAEGTSPRRGPEDTSTARELSPAWRSVVAVHRDGPRAPAHSLGVDGAADDVRPGPTADQPL